MNIHDCVKTGDLAGVARLLDEGVPVDSARESDAYTPLMCAVTSEAAVELVRLLMERGANVNAREKNKRRGKSREAMTVLALAIRHSGLDTVTLLLDAGADVGYERSGGYDALIDALHSYTAHTEEESIALLELLIARGAPLNGESGHGESALSVASRRGMFEVVRALLDAGSDPAPLGWTALMDAIALGTLAEVERGLLAGGDLTARDDWERTPWLLSLQTGEVDKAKVLLAAGANREDRGRNGKTPLAYAIDNKHTALLQWLLDKGFDPEMTNKFGNTPLVEAVQDDCVACVNLLLAAGAQLTGHGDALLIEGASSVDMMCALVEAGAMLDGVSNEARALITGVETEGTLGVSREEYEAGKARRFGAANPERMDIAFWKDMVRCGVNAYAARMAFDDPYQANYDPVWCFQRFGRSLTALPDGRFVEVGGEHEDFHDPDFCIYNEVVVHQGAGQFDIFGYPQDVFPTTDFHSATLVGEFIYLIGGLGYRGERYYGETPVYRLHCNTWAIEKVETCGEKPGWVYRHCADYDAERHAIRVSGGIRLLTDDAQPAKETSEKNEGVYVLDLTVLKWQRTA